ncbi:MAG: tRNA 2-thiouridine(34) synthase MnmA [Myxococcales bacterium]|nr:tRNA 2-thiouridine(34) synthase MnmA [Myxococcales bacterium]
MNQATTTDMPQPPAAPVAEMRADIGLPVGSRVAVAMSGGVDSSVVAGLLVEAGYEVIGLTARLYDVDPTEVARPGSCCAPEDARDARGVSATLGIRHYVLDEREIFHRDVIQPFLDDWRAGRTPNPCVACNRSLKFDRLVARARALGAQALATGHYARLDRDENGRARLRRGQDRGKDQAYFLYPLEPDVASFLRFPLGAMSKQEVRDHGQRLDLAVSDKPESMDICFVGAKKPAEWVASHGGAPSGTLVDLSGMRLGKHDNLAKFTVGQRRGLGLPGGGEAKYVVAKAADGTVTVGDHADLRVERLTLTPYSSVTGDELKPGRRVGIQVRHRARPVSAEVELVNGDQLVLRLCADLHGAACGQAGVVFDEERVLGGGTITDVTRGAGAQ